MATTLNVILEARAKDNGLEAYLRKQARLADGLATSVDRAAAAGKRLNDTPFDLPTGRGGAGRGASSGRQAASSGRAPRVSVEDREAKKRERLAKDFSKALDASLATAKREAKSLDSAARARERVAKSARALTQEGMLEVELARERTRRMRAEARKQANKQLGPDPNAAPAGGRGRGTKGVEFGANVSIAGREFEQLGAKAEQGIRASFDSFRDYEKGVAEVLTLTDTISADEVRAITQNAALEFGGMPTAQVEAFYGIVSAGATTAAEAQEQLNAANKLAVGGVAEQGEAVMAISKAVSNFGGSGEEAADSIFTAVKRGQTTVSQMASALPMVASAAADAGLTLNETNAALAVLSKRLKSPEQAATSLNAALTSLGTPSEKAIKLAKKMGIDFSTAGVKAAGSMEEFLLQIRASEQFDDDTIATLFGSSEAQKAVRSLIAGMDDLRSVQDDMSKNAGAASAAANKMADTAAQKAKKLEAQWEILKITAGESLVPALTDLAGEIGPIIKDVTDWIKENPKLAGTLAKTAIGVAAAAKAVGVLTSAISMGSTIVGLGRGALDMYGKSAVSLGKNAAGSATGIGKIGGAMSKIAGPLAVATAAIVAFELILDAASTPLNEYLDKVDKYNMATADGGLGIDFQNEDGTDKSEEQVLLEQRNRLVDDVNATRTLVRQASGGDAFNQLKSGNIGDAFSQGYGGLFNKATGANDEFERLQRQAELDLRRFDDKFASQIGLTDEQRFDGGTKGMFGEGSALAQFRDVMERQAAATEQVAANTSARPSGPSMEAGLS